MMDWTDRHCRFLHRQLSRNALLYTEMLTADAVIHGERDRLLGFDPAEHPVALQFGGSNPERLAQAARIGAEFGYDEINLNIGCPSDRVQSGTFGACLMRTPALVGACVAAIRAATHVPVTVKCRLGVDDQDTGPALDALAQAVWTAGADALWVHARKAWLDGLSPRQNRDVPPLDYDRVRRLKQENPNRFIGLNGGLQNVNHALGEMLSGSVSLDGAMFGRAAYHTPQILCEIDGHLDAGLRREPDWPSVIEAMRRYAEAHVHAGGRLSQVTRHMVGLFAGLPGARRWRQILSVEATRPGAGAAVIDAAFAEVRLDPERQAA